MIFDHVMSSPQIQRAMPLVAECGPNPEILAQLSQEALKCGEYGAAVQAARLAVRFLPCPACCHVCLDAGRPSGDNVQDVC